jgi:hypothetical protein
LLETSRAPERRPPRTVTGKKAGTNCRRAVRSTSIRPYVDDDLPFRVSRFSVAVSGASSSVDTPLPVEEDINKTVVKKRPSPPEELVVTTAETTDFLVQQVSMSKKRKIECEIKVEEGGPGDYGLDCNDLWMDLNPGAGSFLSFLEEELNAFQGLAADDHDFLPLPLGGPARMDLVGEMYAS